MYKIFYISFLVLWLQSSSFAAFQDDFKIWRSVKNQIMQLKKNKQPFKAIKALNSFEKSFGRSHFIPLIYYEKALIYLDYTKFIEKGFVCLEKAEVTKDKKLSMQIQKIKKRFILPITKIRMKKIDSYIQKYFIDEIAFPVKLIQLSHRYKGFNKSDLKDGYGEYFHYQTKKNNVIKDENNLDYVLLSKGLDKKLLTDDDLKLEEIKEKDENNIFVIATFLDKNIWNGEIKLFNENSRSYKQLIVKEGDYIDEYYVFSIRESGIIFLKEETPVVVNVN